MHEILPELFELGLNLSGGVEGSVTFDKERCASFHFVTSHQVHLQECVKIEVLCTMVVKIKYSRVYPEYILRSGFVKV